ncbi:Adar [Trypoxylus dichotomus]
MTSNFGTKYKVIQKIGEGSFSEVLKCEDKVTGMLYAAKKLKKTFKSVSDVMTCAEIIAMQKLSRHPNVLCMIEYFYDINMGKLTYVFELMDMSMYEYMKVKKRPMPEIRVRSYLYQMLKGLEHLHKNGLFHRDIKPENILVKIPPQSLNSLATNQAEIVKLADLGSIRGIYSRPPYTEYISTRWYRSPECLLTVGYYGPKMDVWAAGCVFYEMLTLKPLFPGTNEIDQLAKIHAVLGTPSSRMISKLKKKSHNCQNFPRQIGSGLSHLVSKFSEEGQNILKLMILYDPESRINVRRLVEHRYFSPLRDQYLINQFRFAAMQQSYTPNGLDSFAKCTGDHVMSYITLAENLKQQAKAPSGSPKVYALHKAVKQITSLQASKTSAELNTKKPTKDPKDVKEAKDVKDSVAKPNNLRKTKKTSPIANSKTSTELHHFKSNHYQHVAAKVYDIFKSKNTQSPSHNLKASQDTVQSKNYNSPRGSLQKGKKRSPIPLSRTTLDLYLIKRPSKPQKVRKASPLPTMKTTSNFNNQKEASGKSSKITNLHKADKKISPMHASKTTAELTDNKAQAANKSPKVRGHHKADKDLSPIAPQVWETSMNSTNTKPYPLPKPILKPKVAAMAASKTYTDLNSYTDCMKRSYLVRETDGPLVTFKQFKLWGVNPSILRAKDSSKTKMVRKTMTNNSTNTTNLKQRYETRRQHRGQRSDQQSDQRSDDSFRKTTSDLPRTYQKTDIVSDKTKLIGDNPSKKIFAKCRARGDPFADLCKMANDVEVIINNNKRVLEEENGLQTSRKKLKGIQKQADRNPVAILNDLRNGLKYDLLETQGPAHAPMFTMSVVVDSQQYIGTGRTKKIAKCKAAEQALKSFIQFPDNCKVIPTNCTNNTKLDFTSDVFETSQNNTNNASKDTNKRRHAAMLLNELYPNAKYNCTETTDLFATFKMTIEVDGQTFVGTGSNKRIAKNAAATSALSKLLYNGQDELPTFGTPNYRQTAITCEEQQRADSIGRLVTEKFASLMANDAFHNRRKVLAGIVMNRDSQLEVISVATGTKCVSGEWLSMSGANLNDMHAEIVSRRCLQLFLFDQLLMLANPDQADKSIFEPKQNERGYRLKPGINFHLYINTAPCGDARLFGPADANFVDRHPNKSSRGRLRVKVESGEGTIPVKNMAPIQTWDGVIQGERLLTMSCSDKIARWNVLGLQGALLAHFIDPIYLETIALGSLFNELHLYRAIYGRINDTLQGLSPPYRLNRPSICSVTSTESRKTVKAPNFSVNWTTGQEDAEIVKTETGTPEVGVSRVCKQTFARKFVELCKSGLQSATDFNLEDIECYSDAKDIPSKYKMAKERLFEAFSKAGYGHWVQKPAEQDQFELEVSEEVMECETSQEVSTSS